MAQEEKDSKQKNEEVVEAELVDNIDAEDRHEKHGTHHKKPSVALIISLSVLGLIVVGGIGSCAAVWCMKHFERNNYSLRPSSSLMISGSGSMMRGRMMNRGNGGFFEFYSSSSSNSDDSSTILSGVVVSTGTDSFVIGGNGDKTTVKTTSSTTYNTTGKTVSVGDSVMVAGTEASGVITATQVRIINQ
jgi:hypothetical protein